MINFVFQVAANITISAKVNYRLNNLSQVQGWFKCEINFIVFLICSD